MTADELIRAYVSVHDRMGEFCEAHPERHPESAPAVKRAWEMLCAEEQEWRLNVYRYLEQTK